MFNALEKAPVQGTGGTVTQLIDLRCSGNHILIK
jgi:hypothetical protein